MRVIFIVGMQKASPTFVENPLHHARMIRFLTLIAQFPDQMVQLPERQITGFGVGSQQEGKGRVMGRNCIARLRKKADGRCLGKGCHPMPQ
jgi:hypothetical protein